MLEIHEAPAEDATVSRLRVALICMPFASADRPSIQLGLIGAIARSAGFPTDLHQFNLDLAAQLSPHFYELLCERRSHMTGEWLFAPAAFGAEAPGSEAGFFEAFPGERDWVAEVGRDPGYFTRLRQVVLPEFIERCLAAADWARYGVVGFSSMFQQNVASLALARRIKARCPDVKIVFGGANMEGEMGQEYARAFPFIDYVISGEADEAFPALLQSLAAGDPRPQLSGLIIRTPDGVVGGGHAGPIRDLDRLPLPEYDSYFARAAALDLLDHYKETWTIPFESSRGCWWGQKHHCTFCGLNGLGMAYRAKTPERVLHELTTLARRHRICSFMAVDNILDLKYIQRVFGPLEQDRIDYSFFYESKANLSREQIHALFRGGLRRIQPGIESMSSHVLQLMRKGCTMLQNVACLKWCRYYGIGVNWNLIWGFPGETEEDYEKELEVLRAISHLEPPIGSGRIWLERFSPHYFDRAAFPVRNMRPEASYGFVYPPHVDLMKAAYFFDYEMAGTVAPAAHAATHAYVTEWRQSWNSSARHVLSYRRTADGILIDFRRGAEGEGTYTVSGANAAAYAYCGETARSARQIADHLRSLDAADDFTPEEVEEAMALFCAKRLMVAEDGKFLSLALPSNPNW